MTIRAATFADGPRIETMVRHFLDSTAYGTILHPTSATIEALVGAVLDQGVILVAEVAVWTEVGSGKGGCPVPTLVGMIAIVPLAHPISGERYGEELAWWVEPDYRRSTIGPKLLGSAEDWSRQNGCQGLKMVAPANSSIGTFYERRGYVLVESAYHKSLM
jgi:ribosomal protein S18 acetylase RimI-like enzyme